MTFAELLQAISADTHIDLNKAIDSGGCAIRFENNVELNIECHNDEAYLFSPVMRTTDILSDDFFASLLQIHLFGVATERCWFGFDASGNQVILFHLLALDNMAAETAIKRIDTLITQVKYWQEHLPKIVNRASRPSIVPTNINRNRYQRTR